MTSLISNRYICVKIRVVSTSLGMWWDWKFLLQRGLIWEYMIKINELSKKYFKICKFNKTYNADKSLQSFD